MVSYFRVIDCPNDNYYKQERFHDRGWKGRGRKMNTEQKDVPIEEILKKTKRKTRLLIQALSEISYVTDLAFREGKYWSGDYHNFRDVIEFKLEKPAVSDLETLMKTILSRATRNGLQADIHLHEEPYETEKGELGKKYGIVIEPEEGIIRPAKMREVTNRALLKTKNAVRYYIRKNPRCKSPE